MGSADNATAESVLRFPDGGPQLFDFSQLRRSSEGLVFCPPPQADAASERPDALLEPFWPEGLGIVRGFFSALDVCAAIALWASGASQEATKRHMEASYAQLKSLGAQSRTRILRSEEAKSRLSPASRYRWF